MNEADASLKSKAPGTRPGGVVRIRRALISVWDKAGIIDLAAALHQMGVGILSTGGTAQALREAEIPVTTVESITGYPAILDGRVKTLHPAIFAAILGKDDAALRPEPAERAWGSPRSRPHRRPRVRPRHKSAGYSRCVRTRGDSRASGRGRVQ